MKNFYRCWLLALISLILSDSSTSWAQSVCTGRFVNPITDICWSCILPISIGAIPLASSGQRDIPNPPSPICACPGVPPRIGVSIGFWEPARQVDVTRTPFCMVALGGVSLGSGFDISQGAQNTRLTGTATTSFYHAHYYINPVLSWMEVLLDFACLDAAPFDVAYLTEVDPLWRDDELTLILNPDAILFANPIAIAACAVDCVAASTGLGRPELFWCAGCQGAIYPMNGRVSVHLGGIQASALLSQRLTAKMHRQLIARAHHGQAALCGSYPMPIMDKTAYKTQLTYPIPNTLKMGDRCCQSFGETTQLWGAAKEFPIKGEDFSYLLFRKRNCCAF
jgi:conjugal transfer pilus assembly protein TraU